MQKCFGKGQDTPLQTAPKEESAEAFLQWVEAADPTTWIVYSDGSLSSEGAASYGFAIHQKDLSICDGSGRLGPAEVFDAEVTGALKGLKAALIRLGSAAQDIVVYLDNLEAATCLRGTPSDCSQAVFVEFQALAVSHGATQVRWIPSHKDIPGNEQADKLAKAASSLPEPEGAQLTLAYLRKVARQKPKEAFEIWWTTSVPEQYKRLNLKATIRCHTWVTGPVILLLVLFNILHLILIIMASESDILSSIDDSNSQTSDQLPSNFFSIMDRQYPDKNKPVAAGRKRKTKGTVLYVYRLCPKWSHGHRATAVQHIKNRHAAQLRPPPPSPIPSNQRSLPAMFASIPTPESLRQAFNRQAYNEAVIGLLTRRRAPFSAVEWNELKDLVLIDYDPQKRRIHCIGHIINLSLQAFLLGSSIEALIAALEAASEATGEDLLVRFSQALTTRRRRGPRRLSRSDVDEDYLGIEGIPALRKLHGLAVWTRCSSLDS
ncbi:hypothetical protein ACKAV7_014086 [Fusarium commune]